MGTCSPLFSLVYSQHCQLFQYFPTDVEALEGYADALTEVGGLTPQHHQAIATKLALDLMEDLNIDPKHNSELLEKETAFIKNAEIAYVRSKCRTNTPILFDAYFVSLCSTIRTY